MGQRQVGASPPGPRAEAPLALAAVGAGGVVVTLALQAALAHGAQVGVQVALAPGVTQGAEASVSTWLGRPGFREGPGWGVRGGPEGTLEATQPTCHAHTQALEGRKKPRIPNPCQFIHTCIIHSFIQIFIGNSLF